MQISGTKDGKKASPNHSKAEKASPDVWTNDSEIRSVCSRNKDWAFDLKNIRSGRDSGGENTANVHGLS
jgi:hypothetical protein